MSTQHIGAEPVRVGGNTVDSYVARHWLDCEDVADAKQVNAALGRLLRQDNVRPLRPQDVSAMAKEATQRLEFERFIAIVKFARLRHLVDV